MHDHEAYTGDRTKEALVAFGESLVPSAGLPLRKHADIASVPKAGGCNMAGGLAGVLIRDWVGGHLGEEVTKVIDMNTWWSGASSKKHCVILGAPSVSV
jgi:hypothetical protein